MTGKGVSAGRPGGKAKKQSGSRCPLEMRASHKEKASNLRETSAWSSIYLGTDTWVGGGWGEEWGVGG